MKTRTPTLHFSEVAIESVDPRFFGEKNEHRATLRIPFKGTRGTKTLCIIGQNPSAASKEVADNTIRYLEKLVFKQWEEYGELLVLNLYSRVDAPKSEMKDVLHPECANLFESAVRENTDFLVVYGKLRNQRAYKFRDRAREVAPLFKGKNVMKLDIDTPYAPHPRNSKILYANFSIGRVKYDFSDL